MQMRNYDSLAGLATNNVRELCMLIGIVQHRHICTFRSLLDNCWCAAPPLAVWHGPKSEQKLCNPLHLLHLRGGSCA